jgi:hypothetical protein
MSKITKVKQDKLDNVRHTGVPEKHGKELLTYETRHPKYNNADVTDARTITQKNTFGDDESITVACFIDKWLDWAEQGYPMLVDFDADRVNTFMNWIVKSRTKKFNKIYKKDNKKVA